ncbi:MAG TPA: uroporphyrinogen decarboxylase family protein [Anaerolineae bacterium]|nr:uroporphyrinogen decarboxylase family protein [Anaerolineae bacterium]HQK13327.1 uroporphyrinogen decarboxylase family protein [Anaerolineae bacterium]
MDKLEAAFQRLLSPKGPDGNDVQFQSAEAKANYQASITRIKDAIQLREPDRVPVTVLPSMFPYLNAGMTVEEAMYDYDKCTAAFKQFILELQPDMHIGASAPGPGKFYEILDYKLYSWPGHGVAPEHCYQCNEAEYMTADEYDLFMTDPSFYFRNFYLPRVFGALGGFSMLAPYTSILEMYGVAFNFVPFALPPVQATFQKLFEAGAEALKWAMAMGASDAELTTLGFPTILGGFTKAPFDVLGDTLRGTKGIMLDIYRRPDKLLAAMDRLVPIMIGMGVSAAQQTGKPLIFIPLHKGADGFLSDEQFKKFYWPTLKQVMLGLIENGCIPFPALEGHWSSRLEIIQDVPRGKTVWMIDQTDMAKVKQTLGQNACLIGNVPSSMLRLGTPQEVREYVKRLIETAGQGGGLIVGNGAFFDEARMENVKAMVEAARE